MLRTPNSVVSTAADAQKKDESSTSSTSFEGVCVANYRHPAPRRWEPWALLHGLSSFLVDPVDPVDPLDSVENSPRPRLACKKYSFGNKNLENDDFLRPGLSPGRRPALGWV